MKLPVVVLVAALSGAACSKPKPHVRVTHLQPFTKKDPTADGCEALGEAEGKGTSEAEARAELRQLARAAGADTVVIDQPVGKAAAGRTVLHAQLKRCAGAATAEATPPRSAPQEAPAPTLEERLSELKGLYEQGLITQEDYDARRQELLKEL